MEIVLPIKDIIDLCQGQDNPNNMIKKLSLWYVDTIGKILSDIDTYDSEQLETVGQILFEDDDFRTYKESWSYHEARVINIKVEILIPWLFEYKPGRHNQKEEDVALSWLLCNKYNVDDFSSLSSDIQTVLIDNFGEDLPDDIKKYQAKKHYIDELLMFDDLTFIEDNKFNIDFEIKEIKELLCTVVKNKKITQISKLKTLCSLIDTFKPSNRFDRKYGDAFILEIFESVDSGQWTEEEIEIWKEEFNIDFEWNDADTIKEQISYSVKQESDYISEKLKTNPNYRHD